MTRKIVDIHSHILPEVDDGCIDTEQSVFVLKQMASIGVTDLFMTPHYCKRREHVTPVDRVKEVYDRLCIRVKDEGINIRLHLGTEMEYSQDGARYIKEGRVCTLAGTKYILIEFPPYAKSTTVLRSVKEIRSIGLIPVIAHVERYKSVLKDMDCIAGLKQAGALLQVNIRSVCCMGFSVHRFLRRAFSGRYIDFLAGDVHAYPIEEKEIKKCSKFVLKYSDEQYLNALLNENAKNTILRQANENGK